MKPDSLPASYLSYPRRRYGMDHERYVWSPLPSRPRVTWPGNATIALWIVPALSWFPLAPSNLPVKPIGQPYLPYPDYRHYTLRDYGNRVGFFRIAALLDRLGLAATVAMNAAVARRHPQLVREVVTRGWEVLAYGVDMNHVHHGGMERATEEGDVAATLETLRSISGQAVRGWLSPAKSESAHTLDILAGNGVDYVCDWINDDMPYAMRAGGRSIHAMPHASETADTTIYTVMHQSEAEFTRQICDQFDALSREARTAGGRVIALSLTSWLSGQPYRIGAVREALEHILGHEDVWSATGAEILDAFRVQVDNPPERPSS